MFQLLRDARITLHPLLPSVQGGRAIHPLQQCQFNFRVDSNFEHLLTRIDAEGFKVYQMKIENSKGLFPKIPSSEMGSLFAPSFTEVLTNLAGDKRWVCRTEGLKPPPARKIVRYPFDEEGLVSKRKKDHSAIILASGKSLEKLIHRAWRSPLIEVSFFLPIAQVLPVVSLLRRRAYTATILIGLLDYCDPIVAKDSDGFGLCFLSKKDIVDISKMCGLEEVEHHFRRYVEEALEEFEQLVTPYWEGILDQARYFWNRIRQRALMGEEGWQRMISRWQEMEGITGFLIGEELLGARLVTDKLVRLFYELRCERATVWAILEVEIPTPVVRDLRIDVILM